MSAPSTYEVRRKFLDIARRDVGKRESGKNQGEWIKKLWPATTYGMEGYNDHQAYCAAGMAYCLQQWCQRHDVQNALNKSDSELEAWRCKSASVKNDPHSNWVKWAVANALCILPKHSILHAGDLVVYHYSHIEVVSDDDGTLTGPFTAIGYNTNPQGSRDGEGCYEKPRSRTDVELFIRILP